MFCLRRGLTPHDELYGLTYQLIDPDLGLYEPIGIHEVSTLDRKKNILSIKTKLWFPSCDAASAPLLVNYGRKKSVT